MYIISNRQVNIDLFPSQDGFHFQHEGQDYVFPSMDKVHEFFQKQPFDTVKLFCEGRKSYAHFSLDTVEVFDSKQALRKMLSYENGGAWIEEKNGKKRFFVDDRGWFQTSFKQVSKEEFLQKLESPSTVQKVLGVGLGILALLPGALEIKERLPLGAKGAGMSLLALQQKSPLLVGVLGSSLLPSTANAQAMGTEFQVNTYTTNNQASSRVAALGDGGFVITWASSGQDGDLNGIFGQRYDSSGRTVDAEFQVNNYTTNKQERPCLAALSDGGFVIAWQSLGQDGSQSGIFGQRYDNNSALFGPEFQINTYQSSYQDAASIAPLNDGGFIATWRSDGQDGNNYGIFGQRYNGNGVRVGAEFQVNSFTINEQFSPSIAALNDGFVITWQSLDQDGDNYGIFAQRYDGSGSAVGSEFQVNTYTPNTQDDPSVAALNDGGFVVTWQSLGQDGDNYGIFAQRYDSSGNIVRTEFQVNTYTTNIQSVPSASGLSDGGFVVTWSSNWQDGNNYGIFGQRYDQSGNAVPLTYQSSTNSSSAFIPSSMLPSIPASNMPTTSTRGIQTTSVPDTSLPSSPSGFEIPVLIDIVYGETYSVIQNGQIIGTFSLSGGPGQFSSINLNTIHIDIDPDVVLQDGDTLTLFTVPQGEPLLWEGITLTGGECFTAEGEFVRGGGEEENSYQVIFSLESVACTLYADATNFNTIPVLISGGFL